MHITLKTEGGKQFIQFSGGHLGSEVVSRLATPAEIEKHGGTVVIALPPEPITVVPSPTLEGSTLELERDPDVAKAFDAMSVEELKDELLDEPEPVPEPAEPAPVTTFHAPATPSPFKGMFTGKKHKK